MRMHRKLRFAQRRRVEHRPAAQCDPEFAWQLDGLVVPAQQQAAREESLDRVLRPLQRDVGRRVAGAADRRTGGQRRQQRALVLADFGERGVDIRSGERGRRGPQPGRERPERVPGRGRWVAPAAKSRRRPKAGGHERKGLPAALGPAP